MENKVIEAIRGALVLREDQISLSTPLEDIARDSMDIVELISVLSNDFGIAVIPKELDKIKDVGDIVKYVEDHKGK
jgi:acyl carrier protein